MRPQAELAVSVRAVVERGLHAELPPHISTLLGLTREESCAVMQGVLRSTGKVEGIDVSEKNHQDVVIFVVDETSKEQTLYLTSPGGALRRMLLVQQGVGRVAKPSKADVEAFRSEKKMWKERMRAGKTGK
ncbi:MAG: hypothetical protein JF563_05100 [Acidobacteriales bacterium]|nr:hypothetical protein [Terriglobales bacterium]